MTKTDYPIYADDGTKFCMVGIYFCDHIIIGREGYYSFSEEK